MLSCVDSDVRCRSIARWYPLPNVSWTVNGFAAEDKGTLYPLERRNVGGGELKFLRPTVTRQDAAVRKVMSHGEVPIRRRSQRILAIAADRCEINARKVSSRCQVNPVVINVSVRARVIGRNDTRIVVGDISRWVTKIA